MGFSTEPIGQIGWFERYGNAPCLNHQPTNSDGLEGAIRNPIQQEEVVGRAFSGSVCSLPIETLVLLLLGGTTDFDEILKHLFSKFRIVDFRVEL